MRTVLLIIDMQNEFHDKGNPAALPNVLRLHRYFTQKSWPIIFTQHGHTNDELTPPIRNQLVKKWGVKGSIAKGSHAWELIPELGPLVGKSPVVDKKNTYDAFVNTELAELLTLERVERVAVVGVMTDCCCDTTGRSSFNRGYETWVVRDACGSASEEQHARGLAAFNYAFGDIPTTAEAIQRLEAE